MNRLEQFYSYLNTTYIAQFVRKYITISQATVGYQVLGSTILLQLVSSNPDIGLYFYKVSVILATSFNKGGGGDKDLVRVYSKIFSSSYGTLLDNSAPDAGYAQIELAVQQIVPDITNSLYLEPIVDLYKGV